ncbi:uncharacterized protein LOC113156279 [Anabas testudineus]|uniref:uncharacterized protein LOC113156279 n=1 Tax=Anabas testudineus TaxID=64144 RepID=UPI000E45DCBC|nr:uncharacterized protein LOC113156279 [Anabas testudineus]
MEADFILTQIHHMSPSSFSVREHQRYQAEKMLMRQFMLMKQQYQVPIYLSAKDMKAWLLAGRSFLEEFQEATKSMEVRKLLLAEMAWTSVRRLCLNQMEQELCEVLKKETYLSLQFRRKVTLAGLQMFLSVFRPKAEQDAWIFLCHLSNKLLSSFTGSHTSKCVKLALFTKLQQTTIPLLPQVVDIALKFLLDEPEPLVEVKPSEVPLESRDFSLTSDLRSRTKAASTHIGTLLAEAAATCFCLDTSFTRARLLRICTSVAWDMVKAIYKRFLNRSKAFHLMDFDESFFIAREGVICAIQDMDDRVQSAPLHLLSTEEEPVTRGCCVSVQQMTDEKKNKEEKQGMMVFFSRLWKKMIRV